MRIKHGVIAGGTGAGKTTFLENIIAQDLQRRFGDRPMPMIIFDGKGDQEFLERLLPHIEAAGRLQDLRVIDPSNPRESARYNPFYSGDALYQEHVNFIFQSFGLKEDFFKGHQEAYLSDLVRIPLLRRQSLQRLRRAGDGARRKGCWLNRSLVQKPASRRCPKSPCRCVSTSRCRSA